jgi:hypothetical protein
MDEVVEQLPAREIVAREFNSLRGRLCTVIESAGLPHKQERAIVTLIKNLSFQNQAVTTKIVEELDENGKLFTTINNRLQLKD